MGIITDFAVADRSQAQQFCDSSSPYEEFSVVPAKGVDPVKLGALYAVLTDSKFDPKFECSLLADRGEEGPWVLEVPGLLVQKLAELDVQKIPVTASAWIKTEELSLGNWGAKATEQFLNQLRTLCIKAESERKSVLLWLGL